MEEQTSMATVHFRVGSLERELENVKRQLNLYVPMRENELQLKVINETVNRIEKDLASLSNKFIMQELDDQKRQAALQRNQANLQIKVLWGVVSTIIGLMTSVLVGYLTHFFH